MSRDRHPKQPRAYRDHLFQPLQGFSYLLQEPRGFCRRAETAGPRAAAVQERETKRQRPYYQVPGAVTAMPPTRRAGAGSPRFRWRGLGSSGDSGRPPAVAASLQALPVTSHSFSLCLLSSLAVTRTLAHQVRPISHLQSLHGIRSPKTLPRRRHAPRFQKWGVDTFLGGTTFNPVIRLTPWRGPKLQTGLRGSSPRQTLAEAQRGGLGSTPQTHCVPEAGGFVARPGWAGPLSPGHDASGGRQEQLCGVCPTTWGRSCASQEPLPCSERLYFLLPVSTLLTSLEALWGGC